VIHKADNIVSNNYILMYKCSVANNNNNNNNDNYNNNKIIVRWDSVVGIVTRYGLHRLGIESWWGLDFLHPSRLALQPTQWVLGLSWV
jgi:hypothetical protein